MNDLIGRVKEWKFHDRVQGCIWIKIREEDEVQEIELRFQRRFPGR
jgi:hypothetical protein